MTSDKSQPERCNECREALGCGLTTDCCSGDRTRTQPALMREGPAGQVRARLVLEGKAMEG